MKLSTSTEQLTFANQLKEHLYVLCIQPSSSFAGFNILWSEYKKLQMEDWKKQILLAKLLV